MRLYAYLNSFIFFSLMVYHREYLFKNNVIDVFICGCADLHYCTDFSLVVASGATPWLWSLGFPLRCFSCCRASPGRVGLSICGSQALEHRLSNCGTQAQLLCCMWDLPGSEIKPVSLALAGRLHH